MRLTGSADPRQSVADTLPGKLPQRKITTGAAAGYSSYGNQIGLATGKVAEVYADEFVAKRMEIGAVIGAAPRSNVVRQEPSPGDVVILLGGRTGRDGCGGATGSSKEHNEDSLATCGAEVQKGNPPTERKIQRLFRHPAVTTLIKRCNDFGAGGVSVAIGELADGVSIQLDTVPKKYEGLDGTELAISESQERMAVVVAAENSDQFITLAESENVEATVVARVTAERRLTMWWRGSTIVDISRDFLNTNGAKRHAAVSVIEPAAVDYFSNLPAAIEEQMPDIAGAWLTNLRDLNVCSQQGLGERFDSTIGAATVLLPYGGKYQLTPAESMVAKLPVLSGDTNTGTIMAHGYNPQLALWSPFHGALYAVIEAAARVTSTGGDYRTIRLSLQEYFEKLGNDPDKWGKPFSALLGAYHAQKQLQIPAIGGKDSMSGTFMDLSVPPTLAAFAVATVDVREVVSPEFKESGNQVVLLTVTHDEQGMPDFAALRRNFAKVRELVRQGVVRAAKSITAGGMAAALSKMSFGNKIGFTGVGSFSAVELFAPAYGSIILELTDTADLPQVMAGAAYRLLGHTQSTPALVINNVTITIDEALQAWQEPLAGVFPMQAALKAPEPPRISDTRHSARRHAAIVVAKPRVLIPVFPGTNCEYDSAKVFEQAGATVETLVMNNLSAKSLEQSLATLAARILAAQIVMLPGGFSAGDEPDGSGKFIAAVFRNPRVTEAVRTLLNQHDGLMLGICNGFQALIKLGLVPYGDIVELTADSPTLTHNSIGRHVARMVNTKVVSTLSPWFNNVQVGDVHTIAVSHGEGRFVANDAVLTTLIANGQIATQYVDLAGEPSCDIAHNTNGSIAAVEGITSPDGRVLGKMGHSERLGSQVAINVPGNKDQQIFAAGVKYFK
jgi:phosphoribosylformylglycinamidine synthase